MKQEMIKQWRNCLSGPQVSLWGYPTIFEMAHTARILPGRRCSLYSSAALWRLEPQACPLSGWK